MDHCGIDAYLTFTVQITTKPYRSLWCSMTRKITDSTIQKPHLTESPLARTSWDSLIP